MIWCSPEKKYFFSSPFSVPRSDTERRSAAMLETMASEVARSMESLKQDEISLERITAAKLGKKMLHQLNEFRKKGTLCDAKLSLEGKEFSVHKVVLASSCPYFNSLFTMNMKERNQEVIELKCPTAERMEDFLTFLYTTQVQLTTDNVEALIVTADYFNVHELKELGCSFLQENLNLSNGIALYGFAGRYHCEPLREITRDFLIENFSIISRTEDFLSTNVEQLLEIVSSDELVIFTEEELYEGILRWVQYSKEDRLSYFGRLFAKVRLGDVKRSYLVEVIANEPLVKEDPFCSALLMQTVLNCYVKADLPTCSPPSSRFVDCVFVNGGRESKGATSSSHIYVPSRNDWYDVAMMTTVRYSHGVAMLDDQVFVMGGYSKSGFTSKVERFDLQAQKWSPGCPLQEAMKGMAVASLNGCLYLAGGIIENGIRLGILQKYNPNLQTWESKEPLQIARSGASLVALGNSLYAIGGKACDNRMLSSMERYSVENDAWETMVDMSQKRAYAVATATSSGNILVVGGINEVGEVDTIDHVVVIRTYLRSCEMYHPNADVWFAVSDVSVPRAFAGVSVLGDKVYIFGGEGTGTRYHSSVESYDCTTNSWEVVSTMPESKKFLKCCKLSLPQGLLKTLNEVKET